MTSRDDVGLIADLTDVVAGAGETVGEVADKALVRLNAELEASVAGSTHTSVVVAAGKRAVVGTVRHTNAAHIVETLIADSTETVLITEFTVGNSTEDASVARIDVLEGRQTLVTDVGSLTSHTVSHITGDTGLVE